MSIVAQLYLMCSLFPFLSHHPLIRTRHLGPTGPGMVGILTENPLHLLLIRALHHGRAAVMNRTVHWQGIRYCFSASQQVRDFRIRALGFLFTLPWAGTLHCLALLQLANGGSR
ncbi:hypothetical protein GGR54DRAFT_463201 [Hypoxylon sp. NC1633]|nr:hypothetical protein GGR54DRAFT_463201 [Hypoxylon sp. NC1633]